MGVDYHAFLGPYVRCKNPPAIVQEDFVTCHNSQCAFKDKTLNRNMKYCSECGKPIAINFTNNKTTSVDTWEVMSEIDEALWTPCGGQVFPFEDDVDIWISNRKIPEISDRFIDLRGCNRECDVGMTTPQEDINKFAEFHNESIKILKSYYGVDAVTLHWGMLTYAS